MKRIIFYLVSSLVVLFCLWLPLHKRDAPKPVEPTITHATTSNPKAVETNPATGIATNEFKPWTRPPGVSDGSWAYALRLREMLLHANHPLDFYAWVVDQDGQPVAGAKLEFRVVRIDQRTVASQAFLTMKEGREQVFQTNALYSDETGWVKLVGQTGKSLDVLSVSKPGYMSSYPDPAYVGMFYDPNGQRNPSGDILATNAWNPNKGYTFQMWKKGPTEGLVRINIGVNLDVEDQGQWVSNYFVKFVPARVEWTNFDGADLMIKGLRHLSGNENRPYEFTFTLSVLNGGLLESGDSYPYLAPANGYQTSWLFENKPQNNPPDYPWTKTAYLKLRNGKTYAGVQIGFCNGGFNFSFDGYLNPSGSFNLEPDSTKLITDPLAIERIDEATRVK